MAHNFKVFLHSYLGFNSNSTLLYGEQDAILIDASQILSDSYRMISEILPMRRRLTHIYVSHFHPDHHFGLAVLKFAFPEAKIVALPSVVKDIVFTSSDKVDLWAIDRFGPGEIPKTTTIPMPLAEPRLELESEEIILSLLDLLRDASDIGTDYRDPQGHGFNNDIGKVFAAGRRIEQQETIGQIIKIIMSMTQKIHISRKVLCLR